MANIEPNQYVLYERACRKKNGKLTPLQMAQVDRLKELDELCRRCRTFPDDQLRCEGTRLIFQPDNPRLVMESCHKLDMRVTSNVLKERLTKAYLPESVVRMVTEIEPVRSQAVVVCKNDTFLFNGHKLPLLSYEIDREGLTNKIKAYIVAMANCGFQGKYLYTIDFYRSWVEGASRIDNIKNVQGPLMDCDWLVIESIDYSNESTYFREALFTVARTRAAQLKPLTLIQTKDSSPQWQSPMEREFFKEATQWPKLSLP